MGYNSENVAFTAEIGRMEKGEGIVEIDGRVFNIGPISRSDKGRAVKFISVGEQLQYCVRSAHLEKINNKGHGIINVQRGGLNIGPVSPEYVGEKVEIIPYNNKAYCVTEAATDEAYPYYMFPLISDPVETPWFPLSSLEPTIQLEVTSFDNGTAHAKFGEYTELTVEINQERINSAVLDGSVIRAVPNLDNLDEFPNLMHAEAIDILSGPTKNPLDDSLDSTIGPTTEPVDDKEENSRGQDEDATEGSEPRSQKPGEVGATSADAPKITPQELTEDEQPALEELRERAETEATESIPEEATTTTRATSEYTRSTAVREYVKNRANGVCEGCGEPAPFISKTGEPYLHAHHIHEISEGGADTPETVVALCPNCHYRIHHGKDGDEYNEKVLKIVQEKEAD